MLQEMAEHEGGVGEQQRAGAQWGQLQGSLLHSR